MRMLRHLLLVTFLLLPATARADRATEGGPKYTDGTEVICDLPLSEWIKNVGGRDGAGLCVFTSIEHSGRWQNDEALRGFQQKMRSEPGGGYPGKVDQMMRKYAPTSRYVQYSGNDAAILDLALKTGRMPAVTYGYSERYGGRVSHMVNLVFMDDRLACVLDNNFIGPEKLEWMSRAEFLRRWKLGGGGWTVILLNPPPPPVPVNVAGVEQVVYGSWGTDCGPVGPSVARPSMDRRVRLPEETGLQPATAAQLGTNFEWRTIQGDPNRLYLFRSGVQIGGWDTKDRYWMDYDASSDKWSDGYPPWRSDMVQSVGCFGVQRDKMHPGESLSVNGSPVDVSKVKDVFGDDSLSDDSSKLRITLIGTKMQCDTVMSDMKSHPALAPVSNKFLVQSYRPGTWPVAVFKRPSGEEFYLSVAGSPNKKSHGVEYHAQTEYRGPEQLALALEGALRRSDPNYDPVKTPDLTKPKPAPVPTPSPVAPAGGDSNLWWLFIAIAVAFLFGGKRHANSQ